MHQCLQGKKLYNGEAEMSCSSTWQTLVSIMTCCWNKSRIKWLLTVLVGWLNHCFVVILEVLGGGHKQFLRGEGERVKNKNIHCLNVVVRLLKIIYRNSSFRNFLWYRNISLSRHRIVLLDTGQVSLRRESLFYGRRWFLLQCIYRTQR